MTILLVITLQEYILARMCLVILEQNSKTKKVLLIYGGDSIKICRLVLKNPKYMQSMYGM